MGNQLSSGVVNVQFDCKDIAMNKLLVTTLESRFRIFHRVTIHQNRGFTCLTEKEHNSTIGKDPVSASKNSESIAERVKHQSTVKVVIGEIGLSA
ncbi:hypothetical protein PsorP6_009533 [Peronosclerospora sorghi]|uniref:Uncharacterized protein n=1 Tax=Peronosclerospora sorghi TaxID=230839 RepID=A0ACC0VZT9_9STRA|nr:hypothetical protein PsorP6_009533 [Peronosclerospora sorghi]